MTVTDPAHRIVGALRVSISSTRHDVRSSASCRCGEPFSATRPTVIEANEEVARLVGIHVRRHGHGVDRIPVGEEIDPELPYRCHRCHEVVEPGTARAAVDGWIYGSGCQPFGDADA